ncbi:MAG: hypothetical protein V1489_01540 [Candidatus Liptonbacteria bacterium]
MPQHAAQKQNKLFRVEGRVIGCSVDLEKYTYAKNPKQAVRNVAGQLMKELGLERLAFKWVVVDEVRTTATKPIAPRVVQTVQPPKPPAKVHPVQMNLFQTGNFQH